MKKLLALVFAGLIAVSPIGAGSASAQRKLRQHVEGTILVTQRGAPEADMSPCNYRSQRTFISAGGSNGMLGYTFEVDARTFGKRFKLQVDGSAGMDISFYREMGDLTQPVASPNISFETAGPGGEKGVVPPGYAVAFVCMTEGYDASFVYTAG